MYFPWIHFRKAGEAAYNGLNFTFGGTVYLWWRGPRRDYQISKYGANGLLFKIEDVSIFNSWIEDRIKAKVRRFKQDIDRAVASRRKENTEF